MVTFYYPLLVVFLINADQLYLDWLVADYPETTIFSAKQLPQTIDLDSYVFFL